MQKCTKFCMHYNAINFNLKTIIEILKCPLNIFCWKSIARALTVLYIVCCVAENILKIIIMKNRNTETSSEQWMLKLYSNKYVIWQEEVLLVGGEEVKSLSNNYGHKFENVRKFMLFSVDTK